MEAKQKLLRSNGGNVHFNWNFMGWHSDMQTIYSRVITLIDKALHLWPSTENTSNVNRFNYISKLKCFGKAGMMRGREKMVRR